MLFLVLPLYLTFSVFEFRIKTTYWNFYLLFVSLANSNFHYGSFIEPPLSSFARRYRCNIGYNPILFIRKRGVQDSSIQSEVLCKERCCDMLRNTGLWQFSSLLLCLYLMKFVWIPVGCLKYNLHKAVIACWLGKFILMAAMYLC